MDTAWLVAVPTTLFLSVYLAAMAAAVVVLRGKVAAAAIPAAFAVVVMLAYCGWLLAIPVVVARLHRGRRARSLRQSRRVYSRTMPKIATPDRVGREDCR